MSLKQTVVGECAHSFTKRVLRYFPKVIQESGVYCVGFVCWCQIPNGECTLEMKLLRFYVDFYGKLIRIWNLAKIVSMAEWCLFSVSNFVQLCVRVCYEIFYFRYANHFLYMLLLGEQSQK